MLLYHKKWNHQNGVRRNNTVEEESPKRRHAYDLGTPDVRKITSNSWRNVGEPFPETTWFMISVQGQVCSTSNCEKYIVKDPNATIDISKKFRQKSGAVRRKSCASSRRLNPSSQSNSQHCPSRADYQIRTVHKYELQSVLQNSNHRLCNDMFILMDLTIHSNRTDLRLTKPSKKHM